MKIKFLQAFNGDSIWISYIKGEEHVNILIDGGTSTTYSYKDKKDGKIKPGDLKVIIEELKTKNQKLDLVILTHIDDDHIDGFLKWFSNDELAIQSIKEVWFNSGRTIKTYLNNFESEIESLKFKEKTSLTSVKQGVNFENYIKDKGVWDEKTISQGDVINWDIVSFQILSPSKEKLKKLLKEWKNKVVESLDTSRKEDYKKTLKKLIEEDVFEEDNDPYNGSSIAFILTKDSTNYLFLGDSHPSEIITELKKLKYNHDDNKLVVELFKVSHHGSKKNTSTELLNFIDTNKYVISTNGDLHYHPDKSTIGRIVAANPKAKIYFNYPNLIPKLILEEDKTEFPDVEFLGTDLL